MAEGEQNKGSRFAKSFRDLDAYQNALQLAADVHKFCESLPDSERYVLANQMRRASRSVCSNISEAWRKRRYKAAFVSKLSDSETEAAEMQSWLDVAMKLQYMPKETFDDFDHRYEHILAQLIRMITDADKWCIL